MSEHRFAIATAVATFLLLLVGGTVNPTGSSLACPEPTLVCNGQIFPPMTGGVLYEHGHRLVAMTVGFLQIILTVLLWRRRPALRSLGAVALGMVIVQGALGAITVAFKLPWFVSTAHLILAMGYLAMVVYLAWRTRRAVATPPGRDLGKARRWILLGGGAVAAQIVLGGLVRHSGAALASVDLPLHHGSLWPAGAPLVLQLHMAHRIGGILVAVAVLVASIAIYRAARGWPTLRRLALAAPVLVALQVTLGVFVIATFRDVPVAVAHFGGAALLWTLWWSMWLVAGGRAPAKARIESADAALDADVAGAHA